MKYVLVLLCLRRMHLIGESLHLNFCSCRWLPLCCQFDLSYSLLHGCLCLATFVNGSEAKRPSSSQPQIHPSTPAFNFTLIQAKVQRPHTCDTLELHMRFDKSISSLFQLSEAHSCKENITAGLHIERVAGVSTQMPDALLLPTARKFGF